MRKQECNRWFVVVAMGLAALVAHVERAWGASPDEVLRAHGQVASWVRAWSVPEGVDAAHPLDCVGVRVTLRLDGQIVGRGQVMFGGDDALASATRMARVEAGQRIVPERDALRDDRLREAAERLTIDLEVAQTLTPLFGETIAHASGGVGPGHDGVAARRGEAVAAVFPGAMQAMNMAPDEAMRAALSDLMGAMTPLAEARKQGAIVYRFDTLRLAQVRAGSAPVFLHRGGRVRSIREVTPAGIRDFGDRVEAHILTRLWPGDEPLGLLGTFAPATGEYEAPMIAPARDQAMAALALAKWARARSVDEASAFAGMSGAIRVLEDLAHAHESETTATEDAVAAGLIVLALREVADVAPDGSLSPAMLALAGKAQGAVTALYSEADGFSEELRAGEHAVIANALAALGVGQSSTRALLRESDPATLPGLMPWIGWAMREAWPEGEQLPGANALLEFRSLCWRHQLSESDLPARDEDLAGGIVFTAGAGALPTAQTARATAFIASMLGDSRLTSEDELRPEVARLASSIRFLHQLEMGPVEAGLMRRPERSEGGIRLAVWDSRLRLDSASMTLLTLAETVNSLQKRTGGPQNADR